MFTGAWTLEPAFKSRNSGVCLGSATFQDRGLEQVILLFCFSVSSSGWWDNSFYLLQLWYRLSELMFVKHIEKYHLSDSWLKIKVNVHLTVGNCYFQTGPCCWADNNNIIATAVSGKIYCVIIFWTLIYSCHTPNEANGIISISQMRKLR